MMQSRRSNTNLSYLTLAPLSSRLPLDDEGEGDVQVPTPWTQRTSYIAGKSAPTTPGILSRTPSQTRLGLSTSTKLASSKSHTDLAFGDASTALSKSKSATVILYPRDALQGQGRRKKTKYSQRPMSGADQGEWIYRAGAAITSEARESKGQSWLVSRESSTSLVAPDREDLYAPKVLDPAETHSPRISRNTSRVASARTSRRGSKVGSRADLMFFTPAGGSRTSMARNESAIDDYFGQLQDASVISGPDFVDPQEDDDELGDDDDDDLRREEEDEVARLASNRGFGLGSVVDRLVGWTLFDVQEDGQGTEDDEEILVGEHAKQEQQAPKREKNLTTQQSHITKQQQPSSSSSRAGQVDEAQGGWADAAWLLSVASKVIL